MQTPAAPPDDYPMGRTSDEYERLRRQAQVWEEGTRRLLNQVCIKPGMSCLDIGCGPGEVMRLMAEAVGTAGSVTGLDMDGAIGREALSRLRGSGASRFEFARGNIESEGEVAGQPFDIVYARLTLLYVRDPVEVLRKMWSMTRAGGAIVVQEFDHSTYRIHPVVPALEEFERVLNGVFQRGGRDLSLGLRLPALFHAAGIGAPDGTDVAARLVPLSRAAPMVAAAYRSVLPMGVRFGLTDEARSAAFLAEMDAAASDSKYFTMTPLLIGAWKRKGAG